MTSPARPLILSLVFLAAWAGSASAADYSAERFDSRIEVLRGGSLRVVETIVFRFERRTFKEVFREISTRRTDGIEILGASMDGTPFPVGTGPGHIEVTRRSQIRVKWRFLPVTDSSHRFELTYIAHGVVEQGTESDVVAWRALPTEHDYAIDSSSIEFDLPARPSATPTIRQQRVNVLSPRSEDTYVRIAAEGIRRNGWIEASLRLPAGTVLEEPPQWQQREIEARRSMPLWTAAAGLVVFIGLVGLFAVHQSYDAPPRDAQGDAHVPAPPDALAPALAGALVANGRAQLEHAMAALFALAERGEIGIAEQPRRFGQRSFVINRASSTRTLAAHEQTALDIIFTGRRGPEAAISLNTARSRLTRRLSRFSTRVREEMAAAGLLDPGRVVVRSRYLGMGIAALVLAGIAAIAGGVAARTFGPWPMFIPGALALVGVTSFICYGAHTPLSNEGVRRSAQWLGFRRYLRMLARNQTTSTEQRPDRLLPFAVAMGLSHAWGKYLKRHSEHVPAWFHALTAADGGQAFVAFVTTGGTGSGGHGAGGGGGGGGAAGGGASGAG